MNLLACFVCLIATSHLGMCLDEKSVKEKRCINPLPPAAKNIDFNWVRSNDLWYFQYASKLDMYRTAADLKGVPASKISEEEFYYDACMTLKWGESSLFSGFGVNQPVNQTTLKEGVFKFESKTVESVTGTLTLTDDKTFIFFYNCWEDDEASWGVVTTSKDLDKETEKKIHEHAKSLGFEKKYFTKLRYETCNAEGRDSKDEL